MKKKISVIALVACLLTILVGTSLAYFMDTDEATNTFTVGSVEIEQNEVFTQDSELLPVVGTDPTVETDNYVKKTVTVKNTGKNAAYVQTYVAVPAVLDNAGVLKLWDNNATTNGWTKDATAVAKDVSITGETLKYNVYRYRYNNALVAGAETAACLDYVYIDSATDLDVNRNANDAITSAYFVGANGTIEGFNVATDTLTVYVASQAVQADGFTDAATALNTAFTEHPFK